ncbi:MAG: DUF1573 domain-containing protein [Pirellulales bacterium]
MLRTVFAALVVLSASGPVALGQEWARKMFETTSHDFGAVPRGAKVEYEFKLSNLYQEDIHIAGVRSSCGCTTPSVTQDTLKTYETSTIVAAFNTRNFLGQKKATVTVTIDQPFYAEVQLHVAGYIRSDVVLHPGAVEFGSVDHGSTAEKTIKITYAGRSDWQIVDVRTPPFLDASVRETGRGNGQVTYDLHVRLKAEAPAGFVKQQLMLVTNDRRATQLPVDVEGRIVSELTVSPASLFMGSLKPGQKVTKQLVVQCKKPFRITAVTCGGESFKMQALEVAKPVHLVPVTFVAGDKPGKVTYRIRIETDLGKDVASELSAYAQVLEVEQTEPADAAP